MGNASHSLARSSGKLLCLLMSILVALLSAPPFSQSAYASSFFQTVSFGDIIELSASLSDATYDYEEFTADYSFTLAETTTIRLTASGSYLDVGHDDEFSGSVVIASHENSFYHCGDIHPELPMQLTETLPAGRYDLTLFIKVEDLERYSVKGKDNKLTITATLQNCSERIASIQARPLSLIPYYPEYLEVTTLPASAAVNLEYTSSNEDVAFVNELGKVLAMKPGNAIITVKDTVSGLSTSVPLEIADISLTRKGKSSYTMSVGDSRQLSAVSNPVGIYQNWSSSNEGVVKVSDSGKVQAVGLGKATITCGAADKDVSWTILVNKTKLSGYSKPFDDWAYKGYSYPRKYFFATKYDYEIHSFSPLSFEADSVFDTIKGYKNGKFVSTSTAKAVKGGKEVMPTATGTVKVVYRVGGTNYTVTLGNVHSVDTLKAKTRQAIKNRALVPSSVSVSSMTFKTDFPGVKARFTVVNAYGVRVTQTSYGYYSKGKFKLNW